ncbi:MAG: hypothetical protein ACJ71I_16285 [Nitrososphaeraceae archaeon]
MHLFGVRLAFECQLRDDTGENEERSTPTIANLASDNLQLEEKNPIRMKKNAPYYR